MIWHRALGAWREDCIYYLSLDFFQFWNWLMRWKSLKRAGPSRSTNRPAMIRISVQPMVNTGRQASEVVSRVAISRRDFMMGIVSWGKSIPCRGDPWWPLFRNINSESSIEYPHPETWQVLKTCQVLSNLLQLHLTTSILIGQTRFLNVLIQFNLIVDQIDTRVGHRDD